MKRPAPHEFLLGNRAITLTLLGGAFFMLYESATAGVSWLCPILLFLVGARAAKARKRVVQYRAWSGAWNNVAGSPAAASRSPVNLRPLRRVLGLGFWGLTLAWLVVHVGESSTDNYRYVGAAFLGLTILGGRSLLRSFNASPGRAALPSRASAKDWPIVRVCLSVPSSSPTPAEINANLPDYCRALLGPHRPAASSMR